LEDSIIKAEYGSLGAQHEKGRSQSDAPDPSKDLQQLPTLAEVQQVNLEVPELESEVEDEVRHDVPVVVTTRRQSIVEVGGGAAAVAARRVPPRPPARSIFIARYKGQVKRLITSKLWEFTSMLVVFFALFLTDIYSAAQVAENTSLDVLLMACFIFFAVELLLNANATELYFNSFFFWMDIIGTASIMFDISFMLGTDAMQPVRYGDESMSSESAVFARASRAAKQAARAGRMSRLLKLLRFLPFLRKKDNQREVVNVLSNQLTIMLATRVAFLSVGLVIMIPLFSTFVYPEAEESMISWAIILSGDVAQYFASPSDSASSRIDSELQRFVEFYKLLPYGPFSVCVKAPGDEFDCSLGSIPGLSLEMGFQQPRRLASILEVEYENVMLLFSLATVRQYESISNLCLMFVVLLAMLISCFVMNSSVSLVVLKPLQRVVVVLRQYCAEIMKMSFELPELDQDGGLSRQSSRKGSKELPGAVDPAAEHKETEFDLLQKVLTKIVRICEAVVPSRRRRSNEEEALFLDNFGVDGPKMDEDITDAPIMRLKSIDNIEDNSAGISAELRKQLEHRTLNLFEMAEEQQRAIALHLISNTRSCRRWLKKQAQTETLRKFIMVIQSKYLENPFHNFAHGLDVLSELRLYLHNMKSYTLFSEVTVFWMLVAALGHDVSHLGVNNQFLVETEHPLALRYNDKSVLENLHCSVLFEVLADPAANVLQVLEKTDFKTARAGIVEVILGTDMVRHNEDVKALSIAYTMHQEAFEAAAEGEPKQLSTGLQEDAKTRLKVLTSLLHTADISNPMKPWGICQDLAGRCLEEFFAQGDKEKELGIPVQMLNDRDKVNRYTSQVGFIEFMIAPLAEQIVIMFPGLDFLTWNLGHNIQSWQELWSLSSQPSPEEFEKLNARISKVVARCQAVTHSAWEEDNVRDADSERSESSCASSA